MTDLAITQFLPVFLIGLFGSAHCLGMCGPIVLAYSVGLSSGRKGGLTEAATHLVYNFGRVSTYVSLGFAGGLLGAMAIQLGPLQRLVSIVAGVLMILFGITNLRLVPYVQLQGPSRGPLAGYRKAVSILIRNPGLPSRLLLGIFNGFLPCGLVYAVLINAASTRSPVLGAATMLAFGLGTVTPLFLLGYLSGRLSDRFRWMGERIASMLVILMGVSLILRATGWYAALFGSHGHSM